MVSRSIVVVALIALLAGCGKNSVSLNLRSGGDALYLEIANHLAEPIILLEGGGLGAPKDFGGIRFEVVQDNKELPMCAFVDPSPRQARIAPGSSANISFKLKFIEKIYCIDRGFYEITAFYSEGGHEFKSRRLVLEMMDRSAL